MRFAIYGRNGCLFVTDSADDLVDFIMTHSNPRVLTVIDNGNAKTAEKFLSTYDPMLIVTKR